MTIFTIDNDNSITAYATAEAAAAASTTPFDLFTNQQELTELMPNWPTERLVETFNTLPGVKPVKSLKDPKADCRQNLGARREAGPDRSHGAGGCEAGARRKAQGRT